LKLDSNFNAHACNKPNNQALTSTFAMKKVQSDYNYELQCKCMEKEKATIEHHQTWRMKHLVEQAWGTARLSYGSDGHLKWPIAQS